jgi:hypothetical protein
VRLSAAHGTSSDFGVFAKGESNSSIAAKQLKKRQKILNCDSHAASRGTSGHFLRSALIVPIFPESSGSRPRRQALKGGRVV